MKNEPKISVIVPIYNVEKYLRQCLDSIVNQTMQEIQIICINDGSSDNSRVILQEYADSDPRIEVIDKPNGGQSTARNAAYPLIKGVYTMFVDADDWIDLDCCEKVYRKATQTDAEITIFFFQRENAPEGNWSPNLRRISPLDRTTVAEKIPLVEFGYTCGKLYRSDFLENNQLLFPEGLFFEDFLYSWKAITMAQRISIVPEKLYHYRWQPESTSSVIDRTGFDTITICEMTEKYLRESGYYDDYRDAFIYHKLTYWSWVFHSMTQVSKPKFLQKIRCSLTVEDQAFYHSEAGNTLEKEVCHLYRYLVDGTWNGQYLKELKRKAWKYTILQALTFGTMKKIRQKKNYYRGMVAEIMEMEKTNT